MTRFVKASLNIFDLHPTVEMHSIKVGLQLEPLDSLYVEPPLNIDDLRTRATLYIIIKENVKVRK